MECILPSEAARLVLGYLFNQEQCVSIARAFLESCVHLEECRKLAKLNRFIQTEIHGYSLEELLDEFCVINTLIVESAELRNVEFSASSKLSERLKTLLTDNNVSSASREESGRKRKRGRIAFHAAGQDVTQDVSGFAQLSNSLDLSGSRQVSTKDLLGDVSRSGGSRQKSTGSAGKRKSGAAITPSKLRSDLDISDESMLDFSEVLSRALDNKELHASLASNINRALTQESGQNADNESDRALDSVVRDAVNDMQRDPCFERFLDEIIAGPVDEGRAVSPPSPQPPPLSQRKPRAENNNGIKSRLRSAMTYDDIVQQATNESPAKMTQQMVSSTPLPVMSSSSSAPMSATVSYTVPVSIPSQSRVTVLPSLEQGPVSLADISAIQTVFIGGLADFVAANPGQPSPNVVSKRWKMDPDGFVQILPKPRVRSRSKTQRTSPTLTQTSSSGKRKARKSLSPKCRPSRKKGGKRRETKTKTPAKMSTITVLPSSPPPPSINHSFSSGLPLINSPVRSMPVVRNLRVLTPPTFTPQPPVIVNPNITSQTTVSTKPNLINQPPAVANPNLTCQVPANLNPNLTSQKSNLTKPNLTSQNPNLTSQTGVSTYPNPTSQPLAALTNSNLTSEPPIVTPNIENPMPYEPDTPCKPQSMENTLSLNENGNLTQTLASSIVTAIGENDQASREKQSENSPALVEPNATNSQATIALTQCNLTLSQTTLALTRSTMALSKDTMALSQSGPLSGPQDGIALSQTSTPPSQPGISQVSLTTSKPNPAQSVLAESQRVVTNLSQQSNNLTETSETKSKSTISEPGTSENEPSTSITQAGISQTQPNLMLSHIETISSESKTVVTESQPNLTRPPLRRRPTPNLVSRKSTDTPHSEPDESPCPALLLFEDVDKPNVVVEITSKPSTSKTPPSGKKPKTPRQRKKCLSTPRRGRPHVRALDFSTPMKPRGTLTSPKVKQSTPIRRTVNRKALLFRSPETIQEEAEPHEPIGGAQEAEPAVIKPMGVKGVESGVNKPMGDRLGAESVVIGPMRTGLGLSEPIGAKGAELVVNKPMGDRLGVESDLNGPIEESADERRVINEPMGELGVESVPSGPIASQEVVVSKKRVTANKAKKKKTSPVVVESPEKVVVETVVKLKPILTEQEETEKAVESISAIREFIAFQSRLSGGEEGGDGQTLESPSVESQPVDTESTTHEAPTSPHPLVSLETRQAPIAFTESVEDSIQTYVIRRVDRSVPIATREPVAPLSSAWDKHVGVGQILGGTEESPRKTWDSDLRVLATPSKTDTMFESDDSDCSCDPMPSTSEKESNKIGKNLRHRPAKTPEKPVAKTPAKSTTKSRSRKAKAKKSSSPRTKPESEVRLPSVSIADDDEKPRRSQRKRGGPKQMIVLSEEDVRMAAMMTQKVSALLAVNKSGDDNLVIDEDDSASKISSRASSECRLQLSSSDAEETQETTTQVMKMPYVQLSRFQPLTKPPAPVQSAPSVRETPGDDASLERWARVLGGQGREEVKVNGRATKTKPKDIVSPKPAPCLAPMVTNLLLKPNEGLTTIVYMDDGPSNRCDAIGSIDDGPSKRCDSIGSIDDFKRVIGFELDGHDGELQVEISIGKFHQVFNLEPGTSDGRKRRNKSPAGTVSKKPCPPGSLDPQQLLKCVDLDQFLDRVHGDAKS